MKAWYKSFTNWAAIITSAGVVLAAFATNGVQGLLDEKVLAALAAIVAIIAGKRGLQEVSVIKAGAIVRAAEIATNGTKTTDPT